MNWHLFKVVLDEDSCDNLEFMLKLYEKTESAVSIFHRVKYKFLKHIPSIIRSIAFLLRFKSFFQKSFF